MKEDVFVQYNSPEERVAAFRRMVAMRQEWETRVRKIVEQREGSQVSL